MKSATLAEPVAPGVPGDDLQGQPAPVPPPPPVRHQAHGNGAIRVPFEIRD
ncbi:hypothetical protein [Mycobacterium shigaense]|uniref:hypothetical protein n=1 Tax=Mycobacterium shigaense TaxID=722731 RepID=UPI0013C2AB7F|nr:hypothetical protein [Mycobacterium shigaense]MEA1122574.1 hypothetical protein [Mycobacterium shigaense]